MHYTMKTKCLFYASLLLLAVGCGQKKSDVKETDEDNALLARVDSIGQAYTDSASVLRIMAMDNTGRLVANSLFGNDSSATPNDDVAIYPGSLMFPVMLASLGEEVDTSTLMLRIGYKDYGNGVIVRDSHLGYLSDSLPVMEAMETHSPVAQIELGWMLYHDKRDIFAESVRGMFPEVEIPSLQNDADFIRFCYGYGMQVSLPALMKCYLRSDILELLSNRKITHWQTRLSDIDGKVTDVCIGYSPDRHYVALVVVEADPTLVTCSTSNVFESIFRK